MKSVLFVGLLVALASQSYAIPGEDTVVPETTIREDPLEKNPSSSARLEDRLGSQVTNVDPPVTLLLEDALEGASEETTEVQERFLWDWFKKIGKDINKDVKKLRKDVKKLGKDLPKKARKVEKEVRKRVKKTEKKLTDFFTKHSWFKRSKMVTDQEDALETTEVQESAHNGQQEGFNPFEVAWRSVQKSVKKIGKVINKDVKKITKIAIPAVRGVMGLRHGGKDCWSGCNRKQGRCSWCGDGFCCRKGWHSRHGCNGHMGGTHNHVCVSKAVEHLKNRAVEKVKNDLIKINIDMKKAGHDLSKYWHHVKFQKL